VTRAAGSTTLALALVASACAQAPAAAPAGAAAGALPPKPWTAAAIAHGGVGSPPGLSDGCRRAVDAALGALERGADPLDAAVEGAVVLEDDPRFNAGTGSRVRIDGATVQMDAAVMDSAGRFGAVAVIERVRNPVRVARALLDTPHLVLAGDGATRFARTLGLAPYEPATPEMRAATERIQEKLLANDAELPEAWRKFDWRRHWNFERSLAESGLEQAGAARAPTDARGASDTIGVLVRASDGRFAAALSTGGTSITLRGRVGDVPIFGAGLYAGPYGAAAATGVGERIIELGAGRQAHAWLAEGASAQEVADRVVAAISPKGTIGIIVASATELAAAADKPMAWAARVAGASEWAGP
jgi:isoaspartyl peptidase/L-asparaginase-like protein (Ntn-hydrolase superfamily)